MDPLMKTAFFRFLGLLLWASLSAWLFVSVEYTEKNNFEEKYQLLRSLYENMASKYNISVEDFNNFSNVAFEALSEPKPKWTYAIAVRFVFQAITTIGYGHITPQTSHGQMLCIFVALLGIPITLLALKSVGELIAKWVNGVVQKFETKILKRMEPTRMQTKSAVILFSLMVVLIVLSGAMSMHLSEWSLLEGVYFWFVTFSTIGFGDYVLTKPQRIRQLSFNTSENIEDKDEISRAGKLTSSILIGIVLTCYYILGLCIISSVVNSIMAAIEEQRCRPRCPGCVPRKTQDHVENKQNDTTEQCDPVTTYLNIERFGFQKTEDAISVPVTELK